jgi:2-hydroxy-6-oxonona-2,4-dienedioate hydrolase
VTGTLTGQWTTVRGLGMFARVGGPGQYNGTAVVLVHGQIISSLYMVPTAERLASQFRVLAPDLPGFGRSDKPRGILCVPQLADALGAWMDAIGLPHAALVGNSLGCQIAVDLAVRRPELVQALVLSGPTIDRHARTASAQIVRWLRDWPGERTSLALAHLRDFARAGFRRSLGTFRCTLADRIEDKLPLVQARTLVVRGTRDTIVPQTWAEEVTNLLPRGRLILVPDGPHCVNYSTPGLFADIIASFLRQ